MNMDEGFIPKIVLIAIVIILIAGGVGAYVILKGGADIEKIVEKENIEIKDEVASIDTSSWQTYRNEIYGFEVKYPMNWLSRDLTGFFDGRELIHIGFGPRINNFPIAINIFEGDALGSIPPSPLFNIKIFKLVMQNTITIGDINGAKYTFENRSAKEICSIVLMPIPTEPYVYATVSSCPEREEFNAILSTFKFIDNNEN